jgi:hypothetical protein
MAKFAFPPPIAILRAGWATPRLWCTWLAQLLLRFRLLRAKLPTPETLYKKEKCKRQKYRAKIKNEIFFTLVCHFALLSLTFDL